MGRAGSELLIAATRHPSDQPKLRHPTPVEPASPHEFVCTYCERGQCARCNDRACTCCYGNED